MLNSFNGTDAPCTLMSGLREFISKASAIFRSLGSLKPDRNNFLFKINKTLLLFIVCIKVFARTSTFKF